MSMTTSVRVGPVRSFGYGGQLAHDLRKGKVPDNIDHSRSHLNVGGFIPTIEEMHEYNEDTKIAAQEATDLAWRAAKASGDKDAIEAAKAAKNACRLKYAQDGVVAYRFVFSFGKEAHAVLDEMDSAAVDALAWESMRRVADALNTVTVGMGCHYDEAKRHYHGFLRAVTNSGRKLHPDRPQCRQIQTLAAEPFKHLGIERGKSKDLWIEEGADPSTYIHASVAELHARLPLELAAARQAVLEAKVELDRIRAEAALADLGKMMAEDESQELQNLVSDLKAKISETEVLGGKWNDYIDHLEAYSSQLDAEIEAKNSELDNLLAIVKSTREQQSIDEQVRTSVNSMPSSARSVELK